MEAEAAPPGVDERLAGQIEGLVLKKIADDTLVLPTMPTVALKCLEVLKTPDFSFREAAAVLERDPVLAARVLKVASSAAFGSAAGTPSLAGAFTRLGARAMKTILVEASARRIFMSKNVQIAAAAKTLWEHSVAVATLSRDIYALCGGKDGDTAYLSGLMHDVGKPVVGAFLLEAEHQITELRNKPWIGSAEWGLVVKRTHRKVGMALAEKWHLPPVVSQSIRDCSEFDPSDRSSVTNAVCMANALSKEAGVAEAGADVADAKTLVMIGRSMLGLDDTVLKRLSTGLRQRIEGLYS